MGTKDGVLLATEHPQAVMSVLSSLSQLRTAVRIGLALNRLFPSNEAWLEFLGSPPTLETIDEFAQVVQDIRTTAELGPSLTPESVDRALRQHQDRALDAVAEFAKLVEVPGEDILAFLINA